MACHQHLTVEVDGKHFCVLCGGGCPCEYGTMNDKTREYYVERVRQLKDPNGVLEKYKRGEK